MYYTRNSDLSYYIEHPRRTNCGSYALRLNEWYSPDEYFEDINGDIYDWIEEMSKNGYDDLDISNMFKDVLIDGMLIEFKGELELCDGQPPATNDVELIAFNTFCIYDDIGPDYDFHFKVLRDGLWMEKCGNDEVKECDENDWDVYIGDVVYLYHKIKETYNND